MWRPMAEFSDDLVTHSVVFISDSKAPVPYVACKNVADYNSVVAFANLNAAFFCVLPANPNA